MSASNPLNIDGSNFDPDAYVSKVLKEKSLREVMDYEHKVVKEVMLSNQDLHILL